MKPFKRAATIPALALVSSLALSLGATTAMASPMDLSTWTVEGGAGNWNLGTGNTSVTQTDNVGPTVFHNNNVNSRGNRFTSTIDGGPFDDDYIGFVLGYQPGDMTDPDTGTPNTGIDYLVIDWKQNTQTASGQRTAKEGLALSRVTGNVFGEAVNDGNARDAYDHNTGTVPGVFEELARGTNLGSTGWDDNTPHDFEVLFGAGGVQVYVDNVLEIDYSGTVSDGAFGFYNFSQPGAVYSLDAVAPIPLPAAGWLLLSAFGGLGLMARRRRKAA